MTMFSIRQKTLDDLSLNLDNHDYEDCTFNGCKLTLSGQSEVRFRNDVLNGTSIEFMENISTKHVINALREIMNGMGPVGKSKVEELLRASS
jgi:hypothetical protein